MLKIRQQIGSVIRTYREAKNLSEESLGLMIGLSQQQIDRYEHGKTSITVDNLLKISEVLGIPVNKFFEGEKINDSMDLLRKGILKQKEMLDLMNKHPELKQIIIFYNKNSKKLLDIDILKLLTKLTIMPHEKRETALNLIIKGKL